jgi:phospholipid/cholesterol/gamma-HCH transport system substrate-binding protein
MTSPLTTLTRRRLQAVAAVAATLVVVSGCSSFKGASSLPIPGGAAHGKTYHVTAVFSDVQDLTVRAAVRVNDVAVGDVTSINLDLDESSPDYLKAEVGMSINQSVHLPSNTVATLDQTTLLGEKFVALSPPINAAPVGRLTNDARLTPNGPNGSSTSELPSVEDVFGLLSQVLNGSDLQDLQTINIEISKALSGRERSVRGALTQLNTFVTGLNLQKHQIVRALVELNRFSAALAAQDGTIATALDDLGPGLKVLADERAQFTSLLTKLSTFGKVATHVIQASKHATITDLADLQPILGHLAAAGGALPRSLEILVTFPFPRDSSEGSPGDYTNFAAGVNLAPIVCVALAGMSPSDLATTLSTEGSTIAELTGVSLATLEADGGCPQSGASSASVSKHTGFAKLLNGAAGSGAP